MKRIGSSIPRTTPRAATMVRALVALCVATPVSAQVFPAEGGWVAVTRGGIAIADAAGDTSSPAIDVVGIAGEAALSVAADPSFLYLRIRVDGDPTVAGNFVNRGWGCQVSIDGDASNYERMVLLDGVDEQLEYWSATGPATSRDQPTDAANLLLTTRQGATFSAHARSVPDGSGDFHIELAVRWSDAAIDPAAALRLVCGSNSNAAPALVTGTSGDIAGLPGTASGFWIDAASDTHFPQCGDGVDNDFDGAVDHPADLDCYAPADASELPECRDGIDNDGDGAIDHPSDTDCARSDDGTETNAPQCADTEDNDLDVAIDFPDDAGCVSRVDDSEADPGSVPVSDRARIVLALATAGSLNRDACGTFTGGDGSLECPGSDTTAGACSTPTAGDGIANDSRIHGIAQAVVRTAAAHPGVELALMRGYQQARPFTCPTIDATAASGGWQGATGACTGAFGAGELLVNFGDDDLSALRTWLDHASGHAGPTAPPPGYDFELRASGKRALAALIRDAGAAAATARASDLSGNCRPYRVVVVADGSDECSGDAIQAATDVRVQGTRVHVIAYAANNATLNDIAMAGGTSAAIAVDDASELAAALSQIIDDATLRETCNGLDDDCDGVIDEEFTDLGQTCGNGMLGACASSGARSCAANGQTTVCALPPAASPLPETCNRIDDDCDGATDEDGICPPTAERCNGIDDDGDLAVDEDFPVGLPCSDDGIGQCRGFGRYQCLSDGSAATCTIDAPGGPPAASDSTCDGTDNDCDGLVDEEAVGAMQLVTFGTSFAIDRYEASRPDADATSAGVLEHRACSKPAALPWRNVTHGEAAMACAAAGKRLCGESEWQAACGGAARLRYPYGSVYLPQVCNGNDHDPDCTPPDNDVVIPTGSAAACPPSGGTCTGVTGVVDASGNVAEWTATPVGLDRRRVRGGGFRSTETALACDFTELSQAVDARAVDVGFRCCADAVPSIPVASPPVRTGAAITNASSVGFEVQFSEPVTGVGASDFVLVGAGATGAAIGAVTANVAGDRFAITVVVGVDGALGLDLLADGTIRSATGHALGNGSAGERYTVDRTAPVPTTSVRTTTTTASPVTFAVTFSEPVTGIDATDFAVVTSGSLAGASVTSVTGSGTGPYLVTVAIASGTGTVRIERSSASAAQDAAGNGLSGAFATSESYFVDLGSTPVFANGFE